AVLHELVEFGTRELQPLTGFLYGHETVFHEVKCFHQTTSRSCSAVTALPHTAQTPAASGASWYSVAAACASLAAWSASAWAPVDCHAMRPGSWFRVVSWLSLASGLSVAARSTATAGAKRSRKVAGLAVCS